MGIVWKWVERLKGLFWARQMDAEAVSEMEFHLEMEVREGIARGLTPEEARRQAIHSFGGVDRYREQVREARWGTFYHNVLLDARYAIRALRARPGYASVVILTLAIGIGAATSLFTVVEGVLLRPLPYPDPDRLVRIENSWAGSPQGRLSPAEFVDLSDWLTDWDAMGAYSFGNVTLSGDGPPERARAAFVSTGVLEAFGTAPTLGRVMTEEEDRNGAAVLVLTDGYWRARFGADPEIVGRSIQVNGSAWEVVGVMPPGFRMPEDLVSPTSVQVLSTLGIDPATEDRQSRGSHFLLGVGRLPVGVSATDGDRLLSNASARMTELYPGEYPSDMQFRTGAVPLLTDLVGPVRPTLLVLFAAVALAFVIVCANVANLLLARVTSRAREFALRIALGAGRGRIVSQVVVESLILAIAGGVLGVVIASVATDVLVAMMPSAMPRTDTIHPNRAVLAFGVGLGVVAGALFSIVPALFASRSRATGGLTAGKRDTGSVQGARLQRRLVTAQIAVAVFLTTGAALVTRSFVALTNVDPGFRTENVTAGAVRVSPAGYPTNDEVVQFFDGLNQAVSTLPGVVRVGAVTNLPLATRLGDIGFELEEARIPEGRDKPDADWQVVTPGYFEAMGLRIRNGRAISSEDRADTRGVVVVNQTMSRTHWGGQSPIGRRIRLGGQETQPRWAEVVGVVDDVRHTSLDQDSRPQMYLAHAQFRFWSGGSAVRELTLVAQSDLPPAELHGAIRRTLAARDPDLALSELTTIEEARQNAIAGPRFTSWLLVGFSLVALTLALLGVYGIMTYSVRQRTREFGIRLALGARPRLLVRSVLGDGLRLALVGAILGLGAVIASSAALNRFLFDVTATDPRTLAATMLGVLLATLLACYAPARLAANADAMVALESD